VAFFDPCDPVGSSFREAVSAAIGDFLAQEREQSARIGSELAPLDRLAERFTQGGKRLRPGFCYWGHAAIAGQPSDPGALLRASAALDLLHVSALMHDDVMDASDTRRGQPAAHRQFENWHREQHGRGDAEAFGRAGAILLGDLLLVWRQDLFHVSGMSPEALARGEAVLAHMRAEVVQGQFLDVVSQTRLFSGTDPLDPGVLAEELARIYRVVDYKSARYSVRHPLEIGLALAGASAPTTEQLVAFGSLVGRAFQFRDDLLGVFGDEQVTGKPAGDDLREGKRTVLVAHALAKAPRAAAEVLDAMLGRPDLGSNDIDQAREIVISSGAVEAVEDEISASVEQALEHLAAAEITQEGRTALQALVEAAVNRQR